MKGKKKEHKYFAAVETPIKLIVKFFPNKITNSLQWFLTKLSPNFSDN